MTLAIVLALGAAVLHACWNVLLKSSGDPLLVSTRALSWGAVMMTPVIAIAWILIGRPPLPPEAWLLGMLSGGVEAVYFICLSAAYRRGDLSVVYPLARGTAPLLAVLAGFFLLHEHLNPPETVGVICLLAGIWTVRRPTAAGPALWPAILTGIAIASYTTIDGVGVRLTQPWLYLWVLWVVSALLLNAVQGALGLNRRRTTAPARWAEGATAGRGPTFISLRSMRAVAPDMESGSAVGREPEAEHTAHISPESVSEPSRDQREPWTTPLLVGLLTLVTYFMVLVALKLAPLIIVAPLRESAIVLVTGWGVWRLRERQGAWLKLGGAAGIVTGVVLVALR